MNEIAKQIEKLMKRSKVTRLKLSNDTGIPYTTLTQIINGRTKNPQVKALEIIADYFNVSLDYLLGQSISAVIENRLSELNMSIEELGESTELPAAFIRGLDTLPPYPGDYEQGGWLDRLAKALKMDTKILASALARQEPPAYDGPTPTPEEAFGQLQKDFENEDFENDSLSEKDILTMAAHQIGHEGPLTDEQLAQIRLAMKIALAKNDK
ncbi:helix-turn-helix protein [compost metagenome]